MSWFRKLLGMCDHTFEPVGHGEITNGKRKIGDYYIVRCSKCGRMKTYNLI